MSFDFHESTRLFLGVWGPRSDPWDFGRVAVLAPETNSKFFPLKIGRLFPQKDMNSHGEATTINFAGAVNSLLVSGRVDL